MKETIIYTVGLLMATVLLGGAYFTLGNASQDQSDELTAVGGPVYPPAAQLAPSPTENYVLTVNGSATAWEAAGAGSSLHVDGGGFVYPQTGDFHAAPYYTGTSTSATSTFLHASSSYLAINGDYLTDITGTGLAVSAGVLSVADNYVLNTGDTMTGQLVISGVATDITTVDAEALTLAPAGAGALQLQAGSGGVSITTTSGNSDITLNPHGTGNLVFTDLTNAVLTVDGSGNVLASSTIDQTYIDAAIARDSELHNAVTIIGEDYLTLSTQQITANAIDPDNLSASDFGDFTCNGTTCTLDQTYLTDMNWSDPVDANIVPDADATRNLGSSASAFNTLFTDTIQGNGATGLDILSTEGNVMANFSYSGSDVNYPSFTANSTGGNVTLTAAGTDTNIGFYIGTKGTGDVVIGENGEANITLSTFGTNQDLVFEPNGSGLVGISTTSPEAKLDVWGDSSGKILTLFSNAGTKFMEMLNTGVTTLLGTWDFSGASLEIPNGTAPTVDATGEVAVDTTSDQYIYYGASSKRVLTPFDEKSVYLASTTIDKDYNQFSSGTTTHELANYSRAVTLDTFYCKTDAGTVNARFGDGTNWSAFVECSTSGATGSSLSNNTFTAREDVQLQVGSSASSPNKVTVSASFLTTAD